MDVPKMWLVNSIYVTLATKISHRETFVQINSISTYSLPTVLSFGPYEKLMRYNRMYKS